MAVYLYPVDCMSILRVFPDQYVNCVVTSPPYWGLRDYGLGEGALGLESTPELYVEHLVEIFREVKRVLRDDGTLWLNLGDSYSGSGKGPAGNLGARHNERHMEHKHGGIIPSGLKSKDLVGIPWRVAFALQADGWYLRSDIIWHKPNPMPESVKDRPTKAHEYVFLLSKSAKYYYDSDAVREDAIYPNDDRKGRAKREQKTYPTERVSGIRARSPANWDIGGGSHGSFHKDGRESEITYNEIREGRNRRSVWTVPTQPYKAAHFATFPEKLIEPCILAGCPEGGKVLDPFAGSGTVGVVATANNRDAILMEANPEYADLIRERNNL